jgi:hypothetical protein
MAFDHFVFFSDVSMESLSESRELKAAISLVKSISKLRRGLIFTPVAGVVQHPFADDENPPPLALQLTFDSIEALEASAAREGALQEFMQSSTFPLLSHARVTHQAMISRRFPVDEPSGDAYLEQCSYLVHYPGAANDLNSWLRHYLTHHPQIMRKFSGIREIEIFTRLDWVDVLRWERLHYFQRNKLVFDDPAALSAALMSPVIKEMRADYRLFPPFTGANVHYVLKTIQATP